MSIRDIVDVAIDEDRHAPCLWVPAEHWAAFSEAVGQAPNRIGVIIYRRKTVREGAPYSEVTTRRPDERPSGRAAIRSSRLPSAGLWTT